MMVVVELRFYLLLLELFVKTLLMLLFALVVIMLVFDIQLVFIIRFLLRKKYLELVKLNLKNLWGVSWTKTILKRQKLDLTWPRNNWL